MFIKWVLKSQVWFLPTLMELSSSGKRHASKGAVTGHMTGAPSGWKEGLRATGGRT